MVDFNKIIEFFKNSEIPPNILSRGQLVLNEFLKPMKVLFEQKCVPQDPWTDEQIELLLNLLSNMDTDKDEQAARVGEREARIASKIQLKTSGGFCHGVGRSGFLTAPQPKAPGGSIMYDLSNYIARHFLRTFGLPNINDAIIVPLSTGMTLSLCLGALKPDWNNKNLLKKRVVIVPRIDHNSISKAIELVGCKSKIVNGKVVGDAVKIPIDDIKQALDADCFAVVSTTSFFPPRESDEIKEISKLAKERDLVHIVVNAYGVQSPEWMKLIRSAVDAGKVDAIIQSTDKNFLTPVGGSIVASPNSEIITKVSQAYAGRASATPIVNFLISALSLGINGYQRLIEEQKKNRAILEEKAKILAKKLGERMLSVFNPVAVAITLKTFEKEKLSSLGAALYNLRVTGPRVVDPSNQSFGTCCEKYPTPYIVLNAAIGARSTDITSAIDKLERACEQVKSKN